MRGRQAEEAQSPQPEGWALSLLAEVLKAGPPMLSEIIGCLEQIETVKEFRELVRMLLPDYESEIMSAPRNRRVYKFCYYFGIEYYPLPANTDCPPADWVDGMPVELMAMSYSAYHQLQMRPGYFLLLSLVIYPYEGDERDIEEDIPGSGARVPLLDMVQRIVGEIDHDLPVSDVLTMDQLLDKSTVDVSFNATLLLGFAALSLLLAGVGLFGVLSYIVSQRTSEIAIRFALGAQREQVLAQVIFDGLRPALFGLVFGLIVSVAATRLVASMLYKTRPFDPAIYALVIGMLLVFTILACVLPAWRASRLDPILALRSE